VKFVHAADIHLDSPLCGLDRYDGVPVELFRGATRKALAALVDLCLDERADFLLLAGDVYDGNWKDYRTGLHFGAEMARLKAGGIPVFLVRGNHDAESEITRHLRLPDNVHPFPTGRAESDRATLAHLGVAVHGQGFASRAVSEDLAREFPDRAGGSFNIGLLHTSLDGRPGHDPYAPTTLDILRGKGYDYWALGHVHRREVVAKDPWVVFPGNLQGRHARETGAKGATVVSVEGGRVSAVEARALDAVRFAACEIDLAGAAGADAALDQVRAALAAAAAAAEGRPVAARVLLSGRTRAHAALAADRDRFVSEVRNAANDAAPGMVWVERVDLATRTVLDLDALARRDDAIGELVQALRDLKGDDLALAELAPALDDLKRKLPPELRDTVRLDDPAFLRAMLDEVEQLLLPRLIEGAESAG
jgi:DNA repair exonuclease SbcCD nuclease subunit